MKSILQIVLWVVIVFLGYLIYDSIQTPIKFQKEKKKRYIPVIKKLEDIRKSEIAYKDVNGKYSGDFNQLVSFIDTAQFTLIQRRDTSYLDEDYKKNYGVDKYVQDIIIDTLGHASVKDSLFKNTDRYKTMMYIPNTNQEKKFELKADSIYNDDEYIPVFEAKVDKAVVLEGLDKNLIERDKNLKSVEDISGPNISVGSLNKVNTNGNWPKSYVKSNK